MYFSGMDIPPGADGNQPRQPSDARMELNPNNHVMCEVGPHKNLTDSSDLHGLCTKSGLRKYIIQGVIPETWMNPGLGRWDPWRYSEDPQPDRHGTRKVGYTFVWLGFYKRLTTPHWLEFWEQPKIDSTSRTYLATSMLSWYYPDEGYYMSSLVVKLLDFYKYSSTANAYVVNESERQKYFLQAQNTCDLIKQAIT